MSMRLVGRTRYGLQSTTRSFLSTPPCNRQRGLLRSQRLIEVFQNVLDVFNAY